MIADLPLMCFLGLCDCRPAIDMCVRLVTVDIGMVLVV